MKTKIIGLTGGIGSGKTLVAKHFQSLGIPVYIADDEAKKIMEDTETISEIRKAFGDEVFTNRLPDTKKIAAIVFNDSEKLDQLNAIIHPRVYNHFKEWVNSHKNHRVVIKEAAILFESGSYKDCDSIILVTAPKEIRIERVMKRDAVSREKVLERMSKQWDEEKKAALSDFVIENISLEKTVNQVNKLFKELSTA